MAKKLSKEEWEWRIKEAGVGRYEFVGWKVVGEFGNSKNCVLRCSKDGYEWSANVRNLVSHGSGCPQCSRKRKWTNKERIEQINSLENISFLSWVDGYDNAHSKANVRCEVDGFEWSAVVNSLVNDKQGCPHCSGKRRWTAEERVEQINSIENIEFVSWVDSYKNNRSKANVKCKVDGFEWSATAHHLVNGGFGCPQCSGRRRWTAEERIEQINELDNIEFVSWVDGYEGGDSKANVRCAIDNFEWSARADNLVNHGTGCPRCARHGYDPSKTGTIYVLRSECGKYVKVGISNNPKRRHTELARATPFTFNLVEQFSGDGVKIYELEKHFHSKYERDGFTGFDGATEWLVCSNELLSELRRLSIEHE